MRRQACSPREARGRSSKGERCSLPFQGQLHDRFSGGENALTKPPDDCQCIAGQGQCRGSRLPCSDRTAKSERTDSCDDQATNDTRHQKHCEQRPSDPSPVEDRKESADCDDASPDEIAHQFSGRRAHAARRPQNGRSPLIVQRRITRLYRASSKPAARCSVQRLSHTMNWRGLQAWV
jgi:hypothetical protein